MDNYPRESVGKPGPPRGGGSLVRIARGSPSRFPHFTLSGYLFLDPGVSI